MAVQVKKITYTPADIYAMGATPQLVLPAPPANYINNILFITHDLVFNSLAYTGVTVMNYGFDAPSGSSVFQDGASLVFVTDYNFPISPSTGAGGKFSTVKDFFVTTDGNAATGDSDIIAYIVYEEKLINP